MPKGTTKTNKIIIKIMKNSKNKSVKNVAAATTKTPRIYVDYTTRLGSTKGRMVGIMTINAKGVVSKFNGQILNQSEQFVTVRDRNKQKNFKISKNTIISLTGV